MPATPQQGTAAIVKWTSPTGGTEVTIKNSDWTYQKMSRVKEAPNTTDGMVRAAGLIDAKGTVKGYVDTTTRIESKIDEGSIGTLKLYTDATKFFSMVAIVENLQIETGVDSLEQWSFDWSLQSGSITEPV